VLYEGKGTLEQMSTAVSGSLRSSLPGFYMIQVSGSDRFQMINVLKR
jgi:hypothetical protein